tara:strand:- start:87 stop:332 length:246 start_codon:yes stop_codon:yes gene_type:complete
LLTLNPNDERKNAQKSPSRQNPRERTRHFFHKFKTAFLTVHLVPLSFGVTKRTCIMTIGISQTKEKDKEKRTKEEKPDQTD